LTITCSLGGAIVLATRSDMLVVLYASEFEDRVLLLRAQPRDMALLLGRAAAERRHLYVTAVPLAEPGAWIPVAHFCRDRMIEPLIAAEMWLFTPGTAETDWPLPACGEER